MNDRGIQTLNQYLRYRQSGDVEACVSLVSDQFSLVSQRDGSFQGKDGLRRYLRQIPYQGTWGQPYWSGVDRSFRVDGKVHLVGLIPVKVKILCNLNGQGQIESVWVGRA